MRYDHEYLTLASWPSSCPINEQTGDGMTCGRCWFFLKDGRTCPRHGDVSVEVERYKRTRKLTLENVMRTRKGLSIKEPHHELD